MLEAVLKMQILSRRGEEDDIVEAMRYLVSARSAFITGETLRVSGGHSLSV
jgi:NAD(P)-dependent dehydrogenase (short-subunit alcohol dehydrogenase family)